MTKLTLSLFDSNTLLPHRAGIAGLALALSALQRDQAPIWWGDPTEIEIKLAWECSDLDAVEWLVRNTYQIEDGYLNVPALKLDLQGKYTFTQGVTSTLLQHGQQRKLASNTMPLNFQIDEGQPEIQIDFRPVLDCYYTRDLKEAFSSKGKFKPEISLKGHHLPGLVECFVNGPYQESPSGFLALLFLPLACGYYKLPGPGLRSALVVPEVTNLQEWVRRRQNLPGRTYKHFHSSGAGESGLRFLLQEQAAADSTAFSVNYCEVYQLGGQPWDQSQTYLKQAVYRIHADERMLALYESASVLFQPQVRRNDRGETWLAVSKVLPWTADNLIAGRPWYSGFFEFRKANELYERQGLVKMKEHLAQEERLFFEAVRGAFSAFLRNQIQEATRQGRSLDYKQATDKVIYRLQRPSTQMEFATALVDFLSQYRSKPARGKGLEIYGWLHGDDKTWRQARDLALLAIATYQGKDKDEPQIPEAETNGAGDGQVPESEPDGYEMSLT